VVICKPRIQISNLKKQHCVFVKNVYKTVILCNSKRHGFGKVFFHDVAFGELYYFGLAILISSPPKFPLIFPSLCCSSYGLQDFTVFVVFLLAIPVLSSANFCKFLPFINYPNLSTNFFSNSLSIYHCYEAQATVDFILPTLREITRCAFQELIV